MEQIKFRAWDKQEEKMIYGDLLDMAREHEKYPEPSLIMQSSDYKDKNGKDIYEGDIVLVKTWVNLIKHKGLVEFNRAAFRVFNEAVSNWSDIEVIGNKFENPELMDGDNVKQ